MCIAFCVVWHYIVVAVVVVVFYYYFVFLFVGLFFYVAKARRVAPNIYKLLHKVWR